MKKLILLFSAILLSGFCSAQSADGVYSNSYGRCFEKEAGEWPKKIPVVSDWQSKNEVITDSRIGYYGNGVQISTNNSSGGNVSTTDGCPQGKIDGIAYRNSSKNNEDKSKKKK